eukprot:14340.XXX_29480_30623_1 [CDS] Oithona nana genome sequencing.
MTDSQNIQVLNFCCHLCGASYATRTCYWSHFQKCSQSNSLPTKCQICSKEFDNDTPSVFYYHMRRKHHNIIKHSWFACSLCGKLFPTEEVLNTHTKTHFKAKKKKEDSWLCEFCSHAESSEEAIIAHTQDVHLDKIQDSWYKCYICSMFYPKLKQMKYHLSQCGKRAHFQRELCFICQYRPQEILVDHMRDVHPEVIKPFWFKCNVCSKMYPTKGSLFIHQDEHALEQLPCPQSICNICDITFTSNARLYGHMKKKHFCIVRKLWHQCDNCQEYFPLKSNFKQHQKKCKLVIDLEESEEEESHPFQVTIEQVQNTSKIHQNNANDPSNKNQEFTLLNTRGCDEDLDSIDKELHWLSNCTS